MLLPTTGPIVVESFPSRLVAQCLSPDGRTAATLGIDGVVSLWSVGTDDRAHLLHQIITKPWPDDGNLLDMMALPNGGSHLALRRPIGGFDVWQTDPAKIVRRIEVPTKAYQWRTTWLPSGKAVLFETGRRPSGDAGASRLVWLDGRTRDLPVGAPWAFTPDGRSLLGTSGTGLALVDLASGKVRRRFADRSESSAPYAFSLTASCVLACA